ncbi:RQC-minor-1 family DNA-binding protein [Niallia sp. MER TA 168]|uniref:RQC-minor-1 family DNA-binding protein n=1 Tax=Niallia sp. MER TA 168 TaxID=2939568 RepID=UPI00203EB3C7|nr:RQC-minor-1 family DNA-binding protein [Niallia sp. MER TA 168]MCM3363438.1 zinc-ribbon domain containing protein [Niallia sp. MER TA 168]
MINAKTNRLSEEEIKAILRAADMIIDSGGRTLLAKILKGSREKKVLQLELDMCPAYGYFKKEKLEEIMKKIDWMIDYDFLDIQYSGKLPMIIFTERGWDLESDQYTDELLNEWKEWIKQGKQDPDMSYLKDRNRSMILLLLEKVRESGDQSFIPYLELWEKVDYKKVKEEIRTTINALTSDEPIDSSIAKERKEYIKKALKGVEPQDILLKCWECGDRFTFTLGEQQLYKMKGLSYPKRCKECRI